jgi:ATP-dependent Lon protease
VRELERRIGAVCRKVAREVVRGKRGQRRISVANLNDYLGSPPYSDDRLRSRARVGVATGLAWTAVGGKILYLEGVLLPNGSGTMKLTGQLGSVMQESASAAFSYLRSRFGERPEHREFFRAHDLHIHIPAGATPKDGPSAGIALASVMLSLLLGRPIDRLTAMTGEITLTGDVLPIGGLKEKVLAAHRAGVRRIILPAANEPDLAEIPREAARDIRFVPVKHIDAVWREIFPRLRLD